MIQIDIRCDKCGKGLVGSFHGATLSVEPCERCIAQAQAAAETRIREQRKEA